MKPAVLIIALALTASAQTAIQPVAAVVPQQQQQKNPIPRQKILDVEKAFDEKLNATGASDPFDLLGNTRGIYLPGYGVVFTTELSLIRTPGYSPMRQSFSKDDIAKVRKRKLDRLPLLRLAMKDMVTAAGGALATMPANEKIVLAVRLEYLPYEDTNGLPGQIVMSATRAAAVGSAIQVDEQ